MKVSLNKNISFSNSKPFVLIAGVNVLESKELTFEVALFLKELTEKLNIPFCFKASYDKANRSSYDSFRGVGITKGLEILLQIKEKLNIPVITDVHEIKDCQKVAEVADILQIPAFLARQTDLIAAFAKTNKIINIKKPQFLSPYQIKNITDKFINFGNKNLLICERGTCFGYDNLVVDMLGFKVMKDQTNNLPLVFDVTHSLQKRELGSKQSGGRADELLPLARAAIATKIAALFLEIHPDPKKALCDGASAIDFRTTTKLLGQLKKLDDLIKTEI